MGRRRLIIANSTPLINFAAIQRLDILQHLFGKIVIPPAVERELLQKGEPYASAAELKRWQATLLEVRPVRNVMLCRLLKLNVDDGEAEAIALAVEQQATRLLLDESRGRLIAESYQLPVMGSIGCLIRAKQKGMIPAIKPLLDAMQTDARFWVSQKLYQTILAEHNE